MAGIDVDKLLSDAHEALWAASKPQSGEQYRDYALRRMQACEALERAYNAVQRELDPPPRSVLFWALLDAEMAAHNQVAECRREASR